MSNTPPSYQTTASVSTSDLLQLWDFRKPIASYVSPQQLAATAITVKDVYNTNTATTSSSLSAANITGGWNTVTLNMTGSLGAGATATFPTVTATVAAISPTIVAGTTYRLRVINSSGGAFSWTVTGGTGWTFAGTQTVAQNTWRDFIVTFTSLTAATVQQVGTGTNS